MNGQIFVCNASPLIGFQRLQRLDLLQTLTDQLLIPQAVRQEVFSGELPHQIVERAGSQSISPWTLSPRFGAGEREAIALALEIGHCILLLDDLAARRTAQSLHIEVLGTIGLLIEARQRELIPELRPLLDHLIAVDFRLSSRLYSLALASVGE